jgi:hypothetical protein
MFNTFFLPRRRELIRCISSEADWLVYSYLHRGRGSISFKHLDILRTLLEEDDISITFIRLPRSGRFHLYQLKVESLVCFFRSFKCYPGFLPSLG